MYSLSLLVIGTVGGIEPVGQLALALELVGALAGILILLGFLSNIFVGLLRDRDDAAAKKLIAELRGDADEQHQRFQESLHIRER